MEKKNFETEFEIPTEPEKKYVPRDYEILVAQDLDQKLNETDENYVKKTQQTSVKNEIFKENQEILKLIPKYTNYMEYMIEQLRFLPRIEKFNIGNEFKKIMYETFENIMFVDKVESKSKLYYLNKVDTGINIQRVFLRIMAKYKWISIEKFNVAMIEKLGEIGRITGGLVKYYGKNGKKSV